MHFFVVLYFAKLHVSIALNFCVIEVTFMWFLTELAERAHRKDVIGQPSLYQVLELPDIVYLLS